MAKLRQAAVALLFAALISAAGAQDFVFSITFDGGGWFDRSFNEGTWNGLTRAVGELNDSYDIDVLIYDGSPDTSAQGQRNIAAGGIDLMVAAGFLQVGAIDAVSSQFPDANFVLIDGVVERDNVRSVLFKEHEGSYLVGYLAGKLSQTGVVGFVGGMDVPLIRKFELGYREGVAAACAQCIVLADYVGDTPAAFNDPPRARELAAAQQAQGADIIYAAAGNSGNGVIDFVTSTMCFIPQGFELRRTPLTEALAGIEPSAEYAQKCQGAQPLFFIGVDSNQNYLGDTDNDPKTLNHGLTSMLKRVDVAAYNAVMDVVNGRFQGGIQALGLAEDGVGVAIDDYNQALIPDAVKSELEQIRQEIVRGERSVPDYTQLPTAQQ